MLPVHCLGGRVELRELVERAQRGDRDAFADLARASIAGLYNVAQLMVGDADLAQDVVQETLIAAWRDLRGLRDPGTFATWVRRILVRTVYREAGRARRRRTVRVDALEWSSPDPSGSVDDRDELERAFTTLTPEHRAVLVVHHYLGLADRAAAETLGIPIGTFKSRLNRATTALRASLEADARRTRPATAGAAR
jgi:RNA polymerase sigma-70 factor (ECF subfamily)